MTRIILFSSFLLMLLLTSCQKEAPDQNILQSDEEVDIEAMIQKDKEAYRDYVAKHGEVTIEHMTLEELQVFVAANDLPPISEETIKNYNSAKRLKTSGACSSGWINYCGDHNGNGTFSSSDLVYFNNVCHLCSNTGNACGSFTTGCSTWNIPSTHRFRTFGYLSYYDGEGQTTLYNRQDYQSAYNFIIGSSSC